MITHSWLKRLRGLVILQAILVLPITVMGSICVPARGLPTLELGVCACIAFEAGPETPTLAEGSLDCGPCSDKAISAVRSSRFPSPAGPPPWAVQLFALGGGMEQLHATTSLGVRSSQEPPGSSTSILRC